MIAMLTDPGDLVVDIFAGSNVTGWVCEHFKRHWLSFELGEEYVEGSRFRFEGDCPPPNTKVVGSGSATLSRPINVREEPAKLTTGVKNPRRKPP